MKFVCSSCGEEHDLAAISLGAHSPFQWGMLSDEERAKSELGEEQCVIESNDGKHFFIRGRLEVPIVGLTQPFSWGVWCSLSEKSFLEMSEHWNDPSREKLGPYFGWLCTRLPGYPDTMYLKTHVHQQQVGLRPLVEVEHSGHQLSVHQRGGIEPALMQSIVSQVLHGE